MAYKFFYDSSVGEVAPTLIDGVPPVDQSAEVAQLTSDLATANTKIAAMQKAIDDAQLNLGPF